MAGILAHQSGTYINQAGAAAPTTQTGIIPGTVVELSVTGATHHRLEWSLSRPSGSTAALVDLGTTAQLTPERPGRFTVSCRGYSAAGLLEATYVLPLSVRQVAVATFVGPLAMEPVAPNQVEPGVLAALFFDSTNSDRLAWKRPDGTAGHVADAESVRGVNVSASAPASGEALVYDGSTYVPSAVAHRRRGTIETTDATPGTDAVLTVNPLPSTPKTWLLRVGVAAACDRLASPTSDGTEITAVVGYVPGSGLSILKVHDAMPLIAPWAAELAVDGPSINVSVTGEDATNIEWGWEMTWSEVTS